MFVNSIKEYENERVVVSRSLKTYDIEELDKYLNKFSYYKKIGEIESDSFEQNTWAILNEDGGKINRRNIKFNFELKQNINVVMKCYLLNLLDNKLGISEIASRVKANSEMLYVSNYFNEENYEDYEEFILSKSENQILTYKDSNNEFISFLNCDIPIEYYNCLDGININVEKNTRVLPDYKSILYFDYVVNTILNERHNEFFCKFSPILLWWKITSVIPIRPIEFLRLKKECFFEEDGKYYLKIKRRKPNSFVERALNNTKVQKFRVSEELYNLAKEYISNPSHISEYFICKNHYNTYQKDKSRKLESSKTAFPNYDLSSLLVLFYNEAINDILDVGNISKNEVEKKDSRFINSYVSDKIVRLQLGDSRHLAIINLILQGTNSFLIKEMAGHRDINSHLHYSKHAQEYISSKIIVMTDILKLELKAIENNKKIKLSVGNKRYNKSVLNNSSNMMKIGKYFCKAYIGKEEMFPYFCKERCEDCNYGILDVNMASLDQIDNEIVTCKTEIERCFEILSKYIDPVDIKSILDKKREKYFFDSQQNISEISNKINNLIFRQANLNAYKFHKQIINYGGIEDE